MTTTPTQAPPRQLSDRERALVRLLQQGFTDYAIGHTVGLSQWGVRYHLRTLFKRYRVSGRIQLVYRLQLIGELHGLAGDGTAAVVSESSE